MLLLWYEKFQNGTFCKALFVWSHKSIWSFIYYGSLSKSLFQPSRMYALLWSFILCFKRNPSVQWFCSLVKNDDKNVSKTDQPTFKSVKLQGHISGKHKNTISFEVCHKTCCKMFIWSFTLFKGPYFSSQKLLVFMFNLKIFLEFTVC